MEALPRDLLLVIVGKLAAQDPHSLLRAVCACKALHRVAEDTATIWREIFHGSLTDKDGRSKLETWSGTWCEELDHEVEALGGYKQLVATQYRGCSNASGSFEQTTEAGTRPLDCARCQTSALNSETWERVAKTRRFLIIVRLRGRPFLWAVVDNSSSGVNTAAVICMQTRARSCKLWGSYQETYFYLSSVRLRPILHTNGHFLEALREERLCRRGDAGSSAKTGLCCPGASVELFNFQESPSDQRSYERLRGFRGLATLKQNLYWRSLYLAGALEPTDEHGSRVCCTSTSVRSHLRLRKAMCDDLRGVHDDATRAGYCGLACESLDNLVPNGPDLVISIWGRMYCKR